MKKSWVRVSFYRKDNRHAHAFPNYTSLMRYVYNLVKKLDLTDKFFFLFEDDPTFMLQLDTRDIKEVKSYVKSHQYKEAEMTVKYIEEPKERNLFSIPFYKLGSQHAVLRALSKDYKDEYLYPNSVKIFHCLCNQMFQTWEAERGFYYRCLLNRGATIRELIAFIFVLMGLKMKTIIFRSLFKK